MHAVTVKDVTARPTLVVPATSTWREFPATWPVLSREVWACLRAAGVERGCPNVMLYVDDTPRVEIGVLCDRRVSPTGRVVASELPSGRVATTVHHGSYAGLGAAHEAVHAWCAVQGLALARTRYELYGPHRDDPAELTTEVGWFVA
jgi:effector-binding domain-containing protein